jgi:hypothetical protein
MNELDFDFLKYLNSLEKMMLIWYEHTQSTLKHPTILGEIREHFIKEVLEKFLPSSVIVGRGEITDGEKRSGQQDIIIYRTNFPVIKGFDSVNLYLIEGVIATIEVKSDLSTGKPNGLMTAFKNLATVSKLYNQAIPMNGTEEEFKDLQRIYTAKTFVVGYKGWSKKELFLDNFGKAGYKVEGYLPEIVYQPGGCIIKTSLLSGLFGKDPNADLLPEFVFCEESPFALFIQSIFKAIMVSNGGLIATAPKINATMLFPLNNYFSLPLLPCKPIRFSKNVTNTTLNNPK